jgi:Methyltransferase domain
LGFVDTAIFRAIMTDKNSKQPEPTAVFQDWHSAPSFPQYPGAVNLVDIFHQDDLIYFENSRMVAEQRVYGWYAAYGAAFRPKAILEIGVRRGYGAYALISGAGESVSRYVGIDMELDIPGSNIIAKTILQNLGISDVSLINANTQNEFPALQESFDLIHIDGDHSMEGALNDIANTVPLLTTGGVIVLDDVESVPVRAALEVALSAFGHKVISCLRGDLHQQALICFTEIPEYLSFAGYIASASPATRSYLYIERSLRSFRKSYQLNDSEINIANWFGRFVGMIVDLMWLRTSKQINIASSGLQSVDDIISQQIDVLQFMQVALPSEVDKIETWRKEIEQHGRYALERLAGVENSGFFPDIRKQPNAFIRGTREFNQMTKEVALNFAAILQRMLDHLFLMTSEVA